MLDQETFPTFDGYVLKDIAVICLGCSVTFVTSCLTAVPPVTEYDAVEADMHRVLPDACLRGALIAVCPECGFASWTAKLKRSSINPEILPEPMVIEHSKKYALAVKTGRARHLDALDLAYIAVNGLYCAREAGEDAELWLELAAYEQRRGMGGELLLPPTGPDHLIMAELYRQLKNFDQALIEYDLALADEDMPKELIAQQKMLTAAGNSDPTILPPFLVRIVFPDAAEATARLPVQKNGRPVPPNITRESQPAKLQEVLSGPPDRRLVLSSAIPDSPLFSGIETPIHDDPADALDTFDALSTQSTDYDSNSYLADGFVANAQPSTVNAPAYSAPQKMFSLAAAHGEPAAVGAGHLERSLATSESSESEAKLVSFSQPVDENVAATAVVATLENADVAPTETTVEQYSHPAASATEVVAVPKSLAETVNVEYRAGAVNVRDDANVSVARMRQSIAMPQSASSVSLVQALQVNIAHATVPNADELKPIQLPAAKATMPDATIAESEPPKAPGARRARRPAKKQDDPQFKYPEIQITDEEAAEYARYMAQNGDSYYGYDSTDSSEDVEDDDKQEVEDQYHRQMQLFQQAQQYQQLQQAQQAYDQQRAQQSQQQPQPQLAQAQQSQYLPDYDTSVQTSAASSGGAAATETDLESDGGERDHTDAIARVEGFLSLTRLPSYQSWIRGYRK